MKSKSPIRVTFWLIIAVMAFFAMAASSPQCASSDDRVLNPGLEPLAGGNPCIAKCNADRETAFQEEKIRFKGDKAACNGEPGCKEEAEALHAILLTEINADMDDCKLACQHEQGSATGGQ
jgi:hypothetical protein